MVIQQLSWHLSRNIERLGGNVFQFEILRKNKVGINQLNQPIFKFISVYFIEGWLDFLSGSNEQLSQNSLIESSTHIFISQDMSFVIDSTDRIKDCESGFEYEITFIDNPVGVSNHYEIYCKKVA